MSFGTILVVDDEKSILLAIRGILEDEGFEVRLAETGEAALESIATEAPDLVLLDIWLEGMDGIETLNRIRSIHPDLGVIMISGHGSIETAVKAIRLGAVNFLEKPLSLPKLVLEVRQALKQQALERENRELRYRVQRMMSLVGQSHTMDSIRRMILTAGPSNGRVLISGESGTGKELVAREIHQASLRAKSPFIEVNCAAIPEELIESELFGHEKGAFTHALSQKKGKFELAHTGTLFLDEIGDMSLKTQAKVLRALEDNRIERVGGQRSIQVDVRVIAASNKVLTVEIEKGRFREDLYYRLNVVPIHIPPLREHPDDIPDLARHYLEIYCREYGKQLKTITPECMQHLKLYGWPGNIRELRNEVERLVIMTESIQIETNHLRHEIQKISLGDSKSVPVSDSSLDLRSAKEIFEREFILQRLNENKWNITQTAELLGIERSNLHRKLKLFGLTPNSESSGNFTEGQEEFYEKGNRAGHDSE